MRIGIVNDMALAREALRRVVASAPGHQVSWLAVDGQDAIAQTRRDRPDLILMDLMMPGIDGAEATRRIMAENPCPILVVTATVSGHLTKVYEAMGYGALDAVDTPTLGPHGELNGAARLLAKVATIAKLIGKPPSRTVAPVPPATKSTRTPLESTLVAIGSSTGGPNALAEVLNAFPKTWKATVIVVQHVDVAFAPGLARWLGERTSHRIDLVENGARLVEGQYLLACTNEHLVLEAGPVLRYTAEPRDLSYRPSVDVFFHSVAAHWPAPGVAVLLTGMGRDGASGMLALRRAGWFTIAQDEATCVVWGMPRAAVELKAAVSVLPVSAIGPAVVEHLQKTLAT
jgi:two-component system response regulator WspF